MQIQGLHFLKRFCKIHANARRPLSRWVQIVEASNWSSPEDVKIVFADVSFVGRTAVFNIGGNKFRLLSYVLFPKQTVVIYDILTHSDYDKLTIK
jgi:mRNA interferase HigB